MADSKELFDYWHQRVILRNEKLIAAPGHIMTQELRHQCTNYDDLWLSDQVQALEEPERSKVIAIIKYECTAKVLQRRSGLLRDRAHHYEAASKELNLKGSRLLKLIKALQEKLFGKDQEIKGLEARITSLVAENAALRAEVEKNDAYDALLKEFEQLRKQYEVVEKRKRELAKNNQSLGGRVAHANRYKAQRDGAIAEVRELKQQLKTLAGENQQLQEENKQLRSDLGKLQKQNKLGIVEIRKHEAG